MLSGAVSPHGASSASERADSDALTPDAALVARFGADLAALAPAGRILVAVSGGADSVALLLLLRALDRDRCIAATVDHGLRHEAAAEAASVAALCGRLGVEHVTLAGALPQRAGRTLNVQARARALRYCLLEAHLPQVGARWLATAHHADDQLETMVMRLNRGAGIGGLAGVRSRGGRIVRPLLGWRHAELAALVAAAGITAIADPSNRDERFDRARLRRAMAEADWIDAERWGRSARALGDAEDALSWAADHIADRWIDTSEGDAVTLYIGDQPPEMVRRLVIRCLVEIDPDIDLRGPEVARLVAAIRSVGACRQPARRATLGRVLITAERHDAGHLKARFALAPPRRQG